MKKIISSIVVSVFSINVLCPYAYAGPQSDARAYVASSQQAARAHAENLFLTYIQDTAVGLQMKSSEIGKIESLSQDVVNSNSAIEKTLNEFLKLKSETDETLNFQDPGKVETLYDQLNDLYVKTRILERARDRQILEGTAKIATINDGVNYVRESILKVCKQGIASNINFKDLPPVRPVPPAFSIYLSGEFSGDGFTSNVPQTAVEGQDMNWVAPVSTVAASLAAGTHAYITTGIGVKAFGGAALGNASLLVGAGVGVAVALIAYGIAMTKAIEQSKDVSDAMWITFNETADAETVRAEFKNLCSPLVEKLENLPIRIQKLVAQDPSEVQSYETQKKHVQEVMTELMKLNIAIQKKEAEFSEEASKVADNERREWLDKKLLNTAERKAYLDYMKSVDSSVFYDALEVELIEITGQSANLESPFWDKKYEENTMNLYDTLYSSKMKKYNADLNVLLHALRKLKFKPETLAAIKEEMNLYDDLSLAYREFDAAMSSYLNELFLLGHTLDSRERLQKWEVSAVALMAKYPDSMSAKVLKVEAEEVKRILAL